jgi:hypothetical protein
MPKGAVSREVLDRYAVRDPKTYPELTKEERAAWAPRPFDDDMSDEAERKRIRARRKRQEVMAWAS